MPSTYTSSLRLTLPATGENSGTWGALVNTGITTLIDTSVAGTATVTMTAADYTLSNNNGTTDEARAMILSLAGTPGAARNVICPAVSKIYIVYNNTTGGFAQTIKTSAGTGVSVPNGKTKVVRCDGTNVVEVINAVDTLSVDSGTANQVQYLNGSKALTGSSNMTFDGTALTLAANPILSAGTANGVIYLNGSKAATSGSAITFDGTNFATTGTASATKFIPTGGSVTGNGMYLPTTNTLAWSTNGVEGMRLDASSNLGIGLTPVANNGILQVNSYGAIKELLETVTITGSAPSATTNFDVITQAVQYYTANTSANFTLNIRGNGSTSLNTIMQTGQSATIALLVTNAATAYRPTAFQVDGSSVTPKWQGGSAPTAGNANSVDIYSFTVVKTGSAAFTVFAAQTRFA